MCPSETIAIEQLLTPRYLESASGTWDVHLLGAFKLLESAGGVEVCKQNPRRRAQIAMLVW